MEDPNNEQTLGDNNTTIQSPRNFDELTIPPRGVSLSYLLKNFNFIEDFTEVCQQVKEITSSFKDEDRSFANFLKGNTNTSQFVKEKADVFISHAWKGSWVETMEALKYHFRNEEEVFIWIDFACIDQHKTIELEFKDWSRVFQTSLEQIGKALIVVVPADRPIVSTRAWCCFEMSQMIQANIPYEICISPSDRQKLIKKMESGQGYADWNNLFSSINVEKSIATKSSDQEAIFEFMKEIGIVKVNDVILNALKRLYVGVARDAEKEAEGKALVSVLNARGALHRALGELDESLLFHQHALKAAESILDNDEQIAIQLNNLAQLLTQMGNYAEAEKLQLQAVEIDQKVRGQDHPNVARDLNNLGLLRSYQGKFKEAEKLHRQALDIQLKTQGPDHPEYASGLNNLAEALGSQGKYAEATAYSEQSVIIFTKVLGDDHPLVATNLNNLAGLLRNQKKFDEAERLYRQTLAAGEKTLGMDHPEVAIRLNNLAILLKSQGKFEEAEPLYRRCNDIVLKALGPDHPNYATGLHNLAELLRCVGRYEESKTLHEQALLIRGRVLGDEHPDLAQSLNSIATMLRDQGIKSKARQYGRIAHRIALKSLGPGHPTTIAYRYWERF